MNFDSLPDGALWDASREGNEEAFTYIRKRHLTALYRYGCKISYNIPLTKECISGMFVDLWFTRAKLGATSSISNYLYATLRRRIYAEVKLQNRFDSLDTLATDHPRMEPGSNAEQDLISVERNQQLEKIIKQVLDSLPTRQKEVIHLRFFGEKSYEEIAQIMDMNPQSAYNLIHRSLKSVRQRFEELGIDGNILTVAILVAWASAIS